MTLIATEIHVGKDLRKSTIFFTADRRVSRKGKYRSVARKIFPIKYLNAGIGFFGIATAFPSGKKCSMSNWLKQFVDSNHAESNMRDFANKLRMELDQVLPEDLKTSYPSGFHLAGFNKNKLPEFWFITNIGNFSNWKYSQLKNRFYVSEDFLHRDACKFGFNGKSPKVRRSFTWIYRNGDVRAHELAWKNLDEMLFKFLAFPDFKKINTIKKFENLLKFKMEIICRLYKKYCKRSIIGIPIDVFSIKAKQS
jgi:hypothetical protein